MLRTFNCGIGMVIVASPGRSGEVIAALQEADETPIHIGEIVAREQDAVVYSGTLGKS